MSGETSQPPERSIEVHVHERDDPRIERILDLIDESARPRPLPEVLGVLCAEVAAIVEAQIASLYVRDEVESDVLVMRANVGFPGVAVGQVRLEVGEGITGFAAECMRPVTVHTAVDFEHYKEVPGLGEEEFPIFLALPILVGRRAEAVLVLQRRYGRPFDKTEIVLATALATVFAYALQRARTRAREGSDQAPRKAQLRGVGRSLGIALGRVETLPTFVGLATLARARGLADLDLSQPEAGAPGWIDNARSALEQVARDHRRVLESLSDKLSPRAKAHAESVFLVWEDQRFLAAFEESTAAEANPAIALRELAKTYARAPYATTGADADESSTARSREVEALCLQVAARIVDERVPHEGSALLLSEGLPVLVALNAIGHRAACIAVGPSIREDAVVCSIARAAELPLVVSVGGLFSWAHAGDRVLVDAVSGTFDVNPSAAQVARFRSET